jgi:hypothetical protein
MAVSTGYGTDTSTWSTVEMQTGLFCISAPCIRPLLRRMFPGLMSWNSHSKDGASKARRRMGGSIYHNGTSFSSYCGSVEGAVQPLEEMELGTVSDPSKNLCSKESFGEKQDESHSLQISRTQSKSLEIKKTFGVSVLDTGPENDEMEISNQNTAIKFEEV